MCACQVLNIRSMIETLSSNLFLQDIKCLTKSPVISVKTDALQTSTGQEVAQPKIATPLEKASKSVSFIKCHPDDAEYMRSLVIKEYPFFDNPLPTTMTVNAYN